MNKKLIIATLVAFSAIGVASAEAPLQVEGSVSANAGSGDFAPYFMMANRGGTLTQPKAVELRVKALKDFDLSERFSYGFGADLVGGYQSKYTQYDQAVNTPAVQGHHPNAIWLQQLYGEVKYRGVYLSVGMKERTSPLMNDSLGVGDYTQSNNARPLPQVRAGFVDFQNIPFTNGWVQIQGEIAYGYYMQDDWFEDHFNYYNGFINTGEYYNYKRCYFRTKPSKPFSVTVGMQMVTEFGGTATSYSYDSGEGKVKAKEDCYDTTWKDFVRAFFASEGGSNPGDASYHYGNTLGSWDFVARYRLKDKSEILKIIQQYSELYDFEEIIPISVKNRINTDQIMPVLERFAVEGEHFFPDDIATDRTERFMCSEIVREKILRVMQEEIPHGVAVDVEKFKSRMKGDTEIIDISVVIICEKESHKGMIIGKGGERLKQIGTMAREDMEDLLQAKVNLQCFVKVKEDWRNRERVISDLGMYDED